MYYVIVAIAVLIAVYIKFAMYRSKKNKKKAKKKYQEMRDRLEDNLMEEVSKIETSDNSKQSAATDSQGANSLDFDEQYPFVSDRDDGYLISLDRDNRKIAITTEQTADIYDFSEIVSCSVDIHWMTDSQSDDQDGQLKAMEQGEKWGRRLWKIMPLRKEQARYYDEVIINIYTDSANQGEDPIRIVLGSNPTRSSSMMGRFILHTAEQVESLINDVADDDNKIDERIGEAEDQE